MFVCSMFVTMRLLFFLCNKNCVYLFFRVIKIDLAIVKFCVYIIYTYYVTKMT